MNKQLLLTFLFVLAVIFSVSAISASDVNVTDSYTTSVVDGASNVSVLIENADDSSVLSLSSESDVGNVSFKSSESIKSNTLSTNSDTNSLSNRGNDVLEVNNTASPTINASETIASKDITKYYKGSTGYTAKFLDIHGNPLNGSDVKITVNGVTYTKKTNSVGVASLAINLKPGTYKIVSENPATGYKLTNTIKVLSTINAKDVTKVYTDGKKFYATFLKSNGKALANTYIKFKINGKTYSKKTNSNGVARLSMTNLKKGTYKMVSYNKDGLTKTNTVKVVSKTSSKLNTNAYTFLKSDSKNIKVTLLNGLGYAPGSGKIIKFTVNGKIYSAKTNSKGVASLKLPYLKAGTYTVKYKFSGNTFYTASSASNKLYILPSKTATFTVKSTTTFDKGANTPFKVALTSGSVPLLKKTINLTVNGKSYVKTTDSKSIISLPIDLQTGKYAVTYKFNGDSKVYSKTGSCSITVKERTPTKVTWKSGTSFYQGAQSYKVLLQYSAGKSLSSKIVKLTLNGKTYSATTTSNGYATFNVNAGPGNYSISFSYSGDNSYAPCNGNVKISVEKKENTGYGYWVYGYNMDKVDLKSLASKGTTDLFLNFKAIEDHGQSKVESWIASANKLGIRVHIWMQVFYEGGKWVNPVKNGKPDGVYFEKKITEAQNYAKIKGISGIHFDYLRYPNNAYKTSGGAAAISQFVEDATDAIHGINSNIIVSAALMPETTSNLKYYGQDYSVISKYLDVVIPMIYKGNYGKTSSWITTTTKWFVDNSNGAQVWAGLQGYKSDDNVTKLSTSAIKTDAQAALDGKAPGVIIFRWGATNFVDFNSLTDKSSSPSTSGSVTIADIITAANNLNNIIDSKNTIPATVTVGGVSYSTAQFLYMMAEAVKMINDGKTSSQVLPKSVGVPTNPSGSFKSGNITTSEYVTIANNVINFIIENGRAPNFASSSSLGTIDYDSLVVMFADILSYYKTSNKLQTSVKVDNGTKSEVITAKTISIKDIVAGATNLKKYYDKNKKLPSTVTAGKITFKLSEFVYLMSEAIDKIGKSNTKAVTIIYNLAVNTPSGDNIDSSLSEADYLKVALNVANYIKKNKVVPGSARSDVGKIIYYEYVDAFSRILEFYDSNKRLPKMVSIKYSSGSGSSSGTGATGTGLNEACKSGTDLSQYLKATKNCQVDNSKIKDIVDKVTKGLTSVKDKATAIYNYVRDNLDYSFYYNTKYGAVGTLTAKRGNCVDHSHLLVAMFRTADIPARYVHGKCTFTSGSTYGHVWVQVLVDNKWTVADATSSKNSLGKIGNWNIHFSLNNIYSELSF